MGISIEGRAGALADPTACGSGLGVNLTGVGPRVRSRPLLGWAVSLNGADHHRVAPGPRGSHKRCLLTS